MACLSFLCWMWDETGFGALRRQLQETFGVYLPRKEGFQNQDKPECLTDLFLQYGMIATPQYTAEKLGDFTRFTPDEIREASEAFDDLSTTLAGPRLVHSLLTRSGLDENVIQIICSTLQPQEIVYFPVILAIIGVFDRGSPSEKLALIFSMFDYDNSGALSQAEIAEVMLCISGDRLTEEEIDNLVDTLCDTFDTNGDGEIQFDEVLAAYPVIAKILSLDGGDRSEAVSTDSADDSESNSSLPEGPSTIHKPASLRLPPRSSGERADSSEIIDDDNIGDGRDVPLSFQQLSVGADPNEVSPLSPPKQMSVALPEVLMPSRSASTLSVLETDASPHSARSFDRRISLQSDDLPEGMSAGASTCSTVHLGESHVGIRGTLARRETKRVGFESTRGHSTDSLTVPASEEGNVRCSSSGSLQRQRTFGYAQILKEVGSKRSLKTRKGSAHLNQIPTQRESRSLANLKRAASQVVTRDNTVSMPSIVESADQPLPGRIGGALLHSHNSMRVPRKYSGHPPTSPRIPAFSDVLEQAPSPPPF